MKKTLGGDRLGSGKRQQVDLHNYNRSTHDLSHVWRSTMSAGTLVPFLKLLVLPGDTIDIGLDCDVKTHPTIGPLFGSYKVQLDIFEAPIRLYNSWLHNNKLAVGLNMAQVKLPQLILRAQVHVVPITTVPEQINPSCILAYLGMRGVGYNPTIDAHDRQFNAVPYIAYWDIYKNYYANKQEEIGAVIHTEIPDIVTTVAQVEVDNLTLPQYPVEQERTLAETIHLDTTGVDAIPSQIMFNTSIGRYSMEELCWTIINTDPGLEMVGLLDKEKYGTLQVYSWDYITPSELTQTKPEVVTFPLVNIDNLREDILATPGDTVYTLGTLSEAPYVYPLDYNTSNQNFSLGSQEGLALKTYQSDLFNNWLKTEWIDGTNGISEITAIDTSGGSFTIDQLNLSRKVYDMLNRIAVSGGSYDDWIDAVYQENRYTRCMSPIYHGGLSKELVFQEVISNAASDTGAGTTAQPLGTLAGKGTMAGKHKGGGATIKVTEPGYIIALISLTPRIDYSQGNEWDTHLTTLDDLHKPALDEIGFQDLTTEQMAWWDTNWAGTWVQKSAGKQTAWINYQTAINKTFGNFAIEQNEMFMTLNRRYEYVNVGGGTIGDLTTYIHPAKFNQIFAQTSLDSQNFWVQIGISLTARRLMSARIMPNL